MNLVEKYLFGVRMLLAQLEPIGSVGVLDEGEERGGGVSGKRAGAYAYR